MRLISRYLFRFRDGQGLGYIDGYFDGGGMGFIYGMLTVFAIVLFFAYMAG
jgi:hypothetical protein